MPLVPAVTELIIAELLYLEKQGSNLPIEMLINSSGTTRQDGEILAFDSEGIALVSAMGFVKTPISTVNLGLAVGWSCCVLASGKKGWRKSLPHSLAMLQQPRVPPTGQRQAIEVHIKWKEVLDFKREYLRFLSIATGWAVDKLDADMQRPLYMRPEDCLEYGLIDEIIEPDPVKVAKATNYWRKSGRAESDGRLEDWQEYVLLQEQELIKAQQRKAFASEWRDSIREGAERFYSKTKKNRAEIEMLRQLLPPETLDEDDMVRLPMTEKGLKLALLNAERFAANNIERRKFAGQIQIPANWKEGSEWAAKMEEEFPPAKVDYDALMQRVDELSPEEFKNLDLDTLIAQYTAPR